MKTSFAVLRVALLGAAILPALRAADTFEGRIHLQVTDGTTAAAQNIDYAIKGDRMRFDPPADPASGGMGPVSIIFNYPKNEMIILMELQGQKMFMRRDLMDPAQKAAAVPSATASTKAGPEPTGRTDTIADYPATEYKGAGDKKGETVELWFAKGLGNFVFPAAQNPMGGGGGGATPGWEKIAHDGGFFPLRVITRDAKGKVKSSFEVTKIDRTPLPDSLFSTDGYAPFQIPGMGH